MEFHVSCENSKPESLLWKTSTEHEHKLVTCIIWHTRSTRTWKKLNLRACCLVWNSTFNARNSDPERLLAKRTDHVTVIRITSFDTQTYTLEKRDVLQFAF